MSKEPFHLPTVITEATNLYKHEAQRKGLDFEVDFSEDLRMVVGDSSKVKTVVANLTANARKESPFLKTLPCTDSIFVSEIHATGHYHYLVSRIQRTGSPPKFKADRYRDRRG